MIDLLLVLLAVGAAILGWRRGLGVSLLAGCVFTIVGLPCAAIAAATESVPPVLAFLLGGLLGLVPFALQLERITDAVDEAIGEGLLRRINQTAGAVLNLFIAACIAWFAGALASIAPSEQGVVVAIRNSAVFTSLVEAVPPQGTLGSVVLRSGLVPAINGPLVLAEPPTAASAATPGVLAARRSVLQVRSTACNKIVKGTGWVAGPGIIITNAHVVAGSARSFLAGGPSIDGIEAAVTHFDPVNDVAVLVLTSSSHALPPPLRIVARVRHGEPGAVIGFPNGGEQRVVPARVDRVAAYDVVPLGGGATVSARVLAFRADVEPGNSGGPLVAEDGSVLGLVVAKGLGQRVEAAYGVASADLLRAISSGSQRRRVSTGRCLTEDELQSGMPPAPARELPGGGGVPPATNVR